LTFNILNIHYELSNNYKIEMHISAVDLITGNDQNKHVSS